MSLLRFDDDFDEDGAQAVVRPVASSTPVLRLIVCTAAPDALTSGVQRALLACGIAIVAASLIALRATNTRGEAAEPVPAIT